MIFNPGQNKAMTLLATLSKTIFMFFGGSRSGKTYLICYVIILRALKSAGSRHVILRKHFAHVKQSIGMDTLPKLLKEEFPGLKVTLNKSDWVWTFPNGSEIWIGGLDDGERVEKILGKEYVTMFFNEVSQISYDAYTTSISRLAQKCDGIRAVEYHDLNPTSTMAWCYQMIIKGLDPESKAPLPQEAIDQMCYFKLNPNDNMDNIDENYLKRLAAMPEAKRRRFLLGEFSDGIEGALWLGQWIADGRINMNPMKLLNPDTNEDGAIDPPNQPQAGRIVVAVDPAVSNTKNSDEHGITVCAVDSNDPDKYYVLEDASLTGSPAEWAKVVCDLYHKWDADLVVAENNQGGDLVESNVKNHDKTVNYKGVRASRGKHTRAEPIAALYEQGKVHHVGEFPELESELTTWVPTDSDSPDRLDSLVWGLTELSGSGTASVWDDFTPDDSDGGDW